MLVFDHWTHPWIGLGYEKDGRGPKYDCLGLFIALHLARFNRVIPDPETTKAHIARPILAPHFSQVEDVQEGDALLFLAGGFLHVGFALDEVDMLHVHKDAAGSVVESYTGTIWAKRLKGTYRYD